MKVLELGAIILTAAVMLTGCGGDKNGEESMTSSENTTAAVTTEAPKAELSADGIYPASELYVKPLGRTEYRDDGYLWCCFSGSGAEFTFTGKKAELTVTGDTVAAVGADENRTRIAIYVDGERVVDELLNKMEKTYTVFESDTEATPVIRVVKLSETAMSTFGIKEIKVDGGMVAPTPDKDRYIEFIGDSITCGYGVDDEDASHHFVTGTEDVTKAYAYKTAAALDADYSMVSISGYGIISGYTDNEKVPVQTIPQYYDKLGFSYASFKNQQPQNVVWDFSAHRQPDMVVINLGTNDDSYCKDDKDKQEEYIVGYVDFLKTVRANNPDAEILCTLGLMGQRLFPSVEEAVSRYTAETGDGKVHTVMLDQQQQSDGIAADWHPTEKSHEKASARVAETIRSIMGW